MQNIFQELQTELDYAIPAKQIPYIDVFEVFIKYGKQTIIIKSECGTGKTYSLRTLKEIGKTLYVSHRRALNKENSKYFTDTCCINSLAAQDLNSYEFVVIDEWTAVSSNFDWNVLNIRKIDKAIKSYQNNLIIIDRDCNENTMLEMKTFTNRDDIAYYEHTVIDREKPILLTKDIEEFAELLLSYVGVKVICTDNAKKVNKLAAKDWGCPVKSITADSIESQEEVLEWAKQQTDAIIITSPAVQEGASFVGSHFVFNGYIWYNTDGIKLPANKIYQGCMRCREASVVRAVCLQPMSTRKPKNVSSDDLYIEYLEKTEQLVEYTKTLREEAAKPNFSITKIDAEYRKEYYELYANRIKTTRHQLKNIIKTVVEEFEAGGFTVNLSSNKPNKTLSLKDVQTKIEPITWVSDERLKLLKSLYDSGRIPTSSEMIETDRCSVNLKEHYETSSYRPNPSFTHAIKRAIKDAEHREMMDNIHRKNQKLFFRREFKEIVNAESLLAVNKNEFEKLDLYWRILNDVMGIPQFLAGDDVTIIKEELDSHELLSELAKLLGKQDAKSNKWFLNFGKTKFGFEVETVCGRTPKYVLLNTYNLSTDKNEIIELIKSGLFDKNNIAKSVYKASKK